MNPEEIAEHYGIKVEELTFIDQITFDPKDFKKYADKLAAEIRYNLDLEIYGNSYIVIKK